MRVGTGGAGVMAMLVAGLVGLGGWQPAVVAQEGNGDPVAHSEEVGWETYGNGGNEAHGGEGDRAVRPVSVTATGRLVTRYLGDHYIQGEPVYGAYTSYQMRVNDANGDLWGLGRPQERFFNYLSNCTIKTFRTIPGQDTWLKCATFEDKCMIAINEAALLNPRNRSATGLFWTADQHWQLVECPAPTGTADLNNHKLYAYLFWTLRTY